MNRQNVNSKGAAPAADNDVLLRESHREQPLEKRNFIWMAVAAACIVTGFLLMLGGSTTTDHFNPDIFSPRRIVAGPTVAFAGYVLMAVAILLKPGRSGEEEDKEGGEA